MIQKIIAEIHRYKPIDHPDPSQFKRRLLQLTNGQSTSDCFANRYDDACEAYEDLVAQFKQGGSSNNIEKTKRKLAAALDRLPLERVAGVR